MTRRALHTPDAHQRFAPVAYRSWFLASTVATMTAVATLAVGSLVTFSLREPAIGLIFGTLSAGMGASAIAVARMRTWGVLLSWVTSATLLAWGGLLYGIGGLALSVLAAPGFMFGLPVLLSRLKKASPAPPLSVPAVPVSAAIVESRAELPRIRIADEDVEVATDAPSLDEWMKKLAAPAGGPLRSK